MKKINTRKLVVIALLIGLNIVFSRLISINAWNFKISLTFSTLFVAGYLYGPGIGALVGGVGDLIGSLAFPIGAYNPLFSLTAIISGFVFGFCCHNTLKNKNEIIAVLISQIGCSLLLNTKFISIVYNSDFLALLSTRVIQSLVMIVIQILVIKALNPFLGRLKGLINE